MPATHSAAARGRTGAELLYWAVHSEWRRLITGGGTCESCELVFCLIYRLIPFLIQSLIECLIQCLIQCLIERLIPRRVEDDSCQFDSAQLRLVEARVMNHSNRSIVLIAHYPTLLRSPLLRRVLLRLSLVCLKGGQCFGASWRPAYWSAACWAVPERRARPMRRPLRRCNRSRAIACWHIYARFLQTNSRGAAPARKASSSRFNTCRTSSAVLDSNR